MWMTIYHELHNIRTHSLLRLFYVKLVFVQPRLERVSACANCSVE
jgi:hypothetical protein